MTQTASKSKRIMSGMRPTGRLHLGHYLGVLVNWLNFQDTYDSYFSIVDWHALTTKYQSVSEIDANIREVALDWLSVGINPEVSTIYVQSAIPEIAELHLLLSMVTPQNWVEREPTLKDMVKMLAANEEEAKEKVTYGLLGYPVLMTADILAFKAELVPVGKDQASHLEFARDVVRRFNHLYGVEYFEEPKPKFTNTPLLKGMDGQKMGKSFNNDIKLADSDEDTLKKIKQAITDRSRLTRKDPGHTELCEVPWPMYGIFAEQAVQEQIKADCESAQIGCVDCKTRLAGIINESMRPFREKRALLAKDPDAVRKILDFGNAKARKVASATLEGVRELMGLSRWY
ncbi:MAG: tryptophan--tRNA ligase [Candidatus Obscuribacterales bacterium]|nr:tryptophan--tRNA ligase [Candidatus Obscuribacterales bacterium]